MTVIWATITRYAENGSSVGEEEFGVYQVDQFILSRRVPMVTELSAETADQVMRSAGIELMTIRWT